MHQQAGASKGTCPKKGKGTGNNKGTGNKKQREAHDKVMNKSKGFGTIKEQPIEVIAITHLQGRLRVPTGRVANGELFEKIRKAKAIKPIRHSTFSCATTELSDSLGNTMAM